jgi:endoglucanase
MNAILTWTANTEPDVAGYKIYRGLDGAPLSLLAAVGKVTTYTDVLPSANTVAVYSLTAFDTATPHNESPRSAEVTKVYDANPPKAPTGLTVVLE